MILQCMLYNDCMYALKNLSVPYWYTETAANNKAASGGKVNL